MVAERNQMILNLNALRIDCGTQSRVEMSQEQIDTYAHQMSQGDKFPEVTVYFNGIDYYLADGFHRYFATKKLGKTSIHSNVVTGTLREAILFSKGANYDNGLPRTNADKRKNVLDMLNDFEWGDWSNGKIAEKCRVSDEFVRKIKAELNIKKDTVKYEKNGKTFERKATNEPVKNKPAAPVEEEFKYDPQAELLESLAAENEVLKDKLAVNQMGGTVEEKSNATEKIAELRERVRVLEAELEAIKITRNSYQTENGQLKKQVAMLQKKLKAAGL
jgi:FtsZ-binding cell division protein ZapB